MQNWPYETPGIPDRFFQKDDSPLTRAEIRAVVISKLRLEKTQQLADIGSGTGSVAIEASRWLGAGQVFAIEPLPERVALIRENMRRFAAGRITVIQGAAPEALQSLPQLDRVFIGGGGRRLAAILDATADKLKPGGLLVMTAVTLETLQLAVERLAKPPLRDMEVLAFQIAQLQKLNGYHLFEPWHAIHVITATLGKEK
jgi:cobalt-precorrin-6B (C15)-methyltransferase